MAEEIIDPTIQEGPGPSAATKAQNYMSATDFFNRQRAASPVYTSDIYSLNRSTPGKDTDKYFNQDFGFNPSRDNEEFYAAQQGVVDKIGRGALKLPLLAVTKLGTGLGYLGGLATAWMSDDPYFTAAADNAFAKGFEATETGLKESNLLATFNEAADREKGFFARAFTDLDFWTDDVVDGAAFMASAFVPGLALSKIGAGTKIINGLGKLGMLAEVGEGAAAAGRIGQAVEGIGMGTKLFKNAEIYAKGLDKFTTWATSTASEAMFEGKGIRDNVYESLDGVRKPNGEFYTEAEKKTIAGNAAKNGFLMNAALLGVTNLFEMPLMYKIIGKADGVATNLVRSTDLLTDLAEKKATTKLGKFLEKPFVQYGKEFGAGTLREGFIEENAQLAIQRYNEQFGAAGKIHDFLEFDNLSGVLSQLGGQTMQALQGNDQEAATSIGLGAILGGGQTAIASKAQRTRDQITTDQAIEFYNKTKENWLKAGNFYKTTTIETTDAAGNPVKQEKIFFDENNQPVVDEQKLAGILSQVRKNTGAINMADKMQNKFEADMIRDNAFAEFVIAHINAGQEKALLQKLDKLTTAKEEDLAKLGFAVDDNTNTQIEKYKKLASTIIAQNKIVNNDIIFDNTAEDQARKHRLTEIAAQQAVFRGLLADQQRDYTNIKDQFITSDMTDASDLIVDQLNDLTYRIMAQQQTLDALKGKTGERKATVTAATKILEELKEQKEELIKNNQLSVEGLTQLKNGLYKYAKDARNDPAFNNPLFKKARLKGELENAVKSLGREWGMYADFKSGKKNFLEMFIQEQVVNTVNNLIDQDNKEIEEENKKEETKSAVQQAMDNPETIYTFNGKKFDMIQLGDMVMLHSLDDNAADNREFSEEEFRKLLEEGKIKIGDVAEEQQPSFTEGDALEAYLKKEYNMVVAANTSKGIAVPSFEDWKATAGKFAVERFNKQNNKPATEGPVEQTEEASSTEGEKVEEIEDVKDYNQDPEKQAKDTRKNNDLANKEFQVGVRQVAPAYSLANTTDLVKEEEITPGTIRYTRDGVNKNYVFDIATGQFMPGVTVTYKVMTKNFEPYVNRLTGEVFDSEKIFDENGKVRPEMFDYAPIGVYAMIRGEERLIGTVHEPQWIEYKIGNSYPHIAVPDSQKGEQVPSVVTEEVNKVRELRQFMLENYNKNSNFVLQGTVASKSLGILRTMEKPGLLKDRVNPKIGEGGIDNRHGMFAIIRNGSIQAAKGVEIENLEATEAFSLDNVNKYQGVPVLLLPTPRGTYFPTFVQLPKLSVEQSQFIIDAWKAFTGQEENPELVKEVYDAVQMKMSDGGPFIGVLKDYIEQYYTMLNDEKLSRLGNGSEVANGVARLNITQDGKMYLQVKDQDGNWFSNVGNPFTKASELPDNILSLMGNLLTNITFPDDYREDVKTGINSTQKTTFMSIVNGKLKKEVMTYNEYMMGRVMTTVEKGVQSETENKDWVYFANPVIQIVPEITTPATPDNFTQEAAPVDPGTTLESDIDTDDLFAQLERLALANEMRDGQIRDESGKCNPFKDA